MVPLISLLPHVELEQVHGAWVWVMGATAVTTHRATLAGEGRALGHELAVHHARRHDHAVAI